MVIITGVPDSVVSAITGADMPVIKRNIPAASTKLFTTPLELTNVAMGNCTLVGVCAASVPLESTVAVVELSHAVIYIVTGPVG